MVLDVRRISQHADPELFATACSIRQRVFLDEYGLHPDEDTEPVDFAETTFHFLGFDTELQDYVAVARSVWIPHTQQVQLGRIAILPKARGRGHGQVIMAFAEQELQTWRSDVPVTRMFLFSIPEKCAFYRRCGFESSGLTENIRDLLLHEMIKDL